MKKIGYFLIIIGLSLLIYLGINYLQERNKIKSPIPEEEGVRVIFVTPKEER